MAEDRLLTFPCAFPIKIIGLAVDDFAQKMLAIVQRHAPDFVAHTMTLRPSSGGKYLALTCTLEARSQAQLDALYRELSAHPLVKAVL